MYDIGTTTVSSFRCQKHVPDKLDLGNLICFIFLEGYVYLQYHIIKLCDVGVLEGD